MKPAKNILLSFILLIIFWLIPPLDGYGFGFVAHRKINRMAVFTLPPEMIGFFKKHIEYLSERAIDPDRRAHAVPGEAPRHYIDIDHFGENPFELMPRQWNLAVKKYSEDTLLLHGVLPWHVNIMMGRLTHAFRDRDIDRILYTAAHIGHYISDACTPLHTSKYYNGRTPEQRGIHALWESRIPELLGEQFNFLVGRAQYLNSPHDRVWELVEISHAKVNRIYEVYDSLMRNYTADRIYSHEMRGMAGNRVFSREFTLAFHLGMNNMVEEHMRLAVKSVGDFWFTAWVNAGQPDLYQLERRAISREHRRQIEREQKLWQNSGEPAGRPNPE